MTIEHFDPSSVDDIIFDEDFLYDNDEDQAKVHDEIRRKTMRRRQ
jgi:hypothetical protein